MSTERQCSIVRKVCDRTGRIEARHGRTLAEAAAISGALTLLTNIVMAWNTNAMQRAIDRLPHDLFPETHRAHIAPVAHRHINMQDRSVA